MEQVRHTADAEVPKEALQNRQQTRAELVLNVAIVGGGKACSDLLHLLDAERFSRLKLKILGVFDKNDEAPGIRYAKELNLFVTDRMEDLFALEGLNLIIELTGVAALQNEIYAKRPAGVSVMDHKAARLLWDLIQIEAERSRLESERQDYQRKSRAQTQVILDSLPYRVMVVNMDMTIDAVNRTFLKEHALTYQEAVGRPCVRRAGRRRGR